MDGIKNHETRATLVKNESGDWELIDVDINIIPVVNWLNSLSSIRTEYSCEEDSKGPYVVFYCNNLDDLNKVTSLIQRFTWEPDWVYDCFHCKETGLRLEINYFYGGARFQIIWKDASQLRRFINYLNL